ncbi:hypothetical protein HKX48_001116 [Thoreauomyces humboldtii]|nr:hypothetical protein HKX48_001116 [Thoreauomyces humboldtii]
MNDTISVEDCNTALDYLSGNYSEGFDNFEFNLTSEFIVVEGIAAATLHGMLLVLFSDRLKGIQHRPTRIWFFTVIIVDVIYWINLAIGNQIPWYFENAGSNLYFYTGAFTVATYNTSLAMLQYVRIQDSLRMTFGRQVQLALYIPVFIELCLEMASQLYSAVLFSVTLNYDQPLYILGLVWTVTAYRCLLDLMMSSYSLWIVWKTSRGIGNHSAENTALGLAYLGRMAVFLMIDLLLAVGLSINDGGLDLTLPHLTIWIVPRLLLPFKPYLLLTDVARIRMLAETLGKKESTKTSSNAIESSGERTRNVKNSVLNDEE